MIIRYDIVAASLGENPLSMEQDIIRPWGAAVSGEIVAPPGRVVNLRGALITATVTADGVEVWAGSFPVSGQLISSDQIRIFASRLEWKPGQAIRLEVQVSGPGGDHSGAWDFVAPEAEAE